MGGIAKHVWKIFFCWWNYLLKALFELPNLARPKCKYSLKHPKPMKSEKFIGYAIYNLPW